MIRGGILMAFLGILGACSGDASEEQANQIQVRFQQAWALGASPKGDSLRLELGRLPLRNPHVWYCRAWTLNREGMGAKALKTADSLTMGYPAFAEGFYLRANLRAASNDPKGALQDYGKALTKKPAFPEALINRGSLHFSQKHPDLALADFKQANRLAPGRSNALFNIGNCFAVLGQTDSACAYWMRSREGGFLPADSLVQKFCVNSKP